MMLLEGKAHAGVHLTAQFHFQQPFGHKGHGTTLKYLHILLKSTFFKSYRYLILEFIFLWLHIHLFFPPKEYITNV